MATMGCLTMTMVLLVPAVSAAQTAHIDRVTTSLLLTVRTYDTFHVWGPDLLTAQATAARALHEAGIEISWNDCSLADGAPAIASPRCNQPLDSSEVMLRIVGSDLNDMNHSMSMGVSMVNLGGGKVPCLATVFADRVWYVARSASVNAARLLGLAISHELGHLLLDTNLHAMTGLMRPAWSRSELRQARADDWRFLADDADAMRTRLRNRVRRER